MIIRVKDNMIGFYCETSEENSLLPPIRDWLGPRLKGTFLIRLYKAPPVPHSLIIKDKEMV